MRARGTSLLVLFAVVLAMSGTASAHVAGTPPISTSGSFHLTGRGTPNETYHTYFTALGDSRGPIFLPGSGDTLKFSWSANAGLGPAVYFEIHVHPNTTGYVRYYGTTAIRVDDSWAVPGPGDYMVFWDNPNPANVTVTYAFQLIAPPDLTPLLAFPAVLAGIGIAIWFDRRRRKRSKS